MKYLIGILLVATCALTSPALAQTSYESVTRPQAELMDGLIVRQCPQGDRNARWVALEEINYALRGDRAARDAGTRIYTERYEASGCGAPPRRVNVQVLHGGSAAPNPVPILLPPGESAIGAGTMIDFFRTHVPQLLALRHPTCRSAPPGEPIFLVSDTTVLSGTPFAVDETWIERWSYRACGVADTIDISFTSNGERVRMSMSLTVPASTP